jgi:hypothetical protein
VVLLEACPPLATAAKENIQRNGAAARSERFFFMENMGLSIAIGSMVLVYLPTKLGH